MSSEESLRVVLKLQRIQLIPGWLKLLAILGLGFHLLSYFFLAFYWFQPHLSDAVSINIERSLANFILISACFVVVISLRDPHKLLPHIIHTLSDRPVSSTTELSTAKFALALADNIAYLY